MTNDDFWTIALEMGSTGHRLHFRFGDHEYAAYVYISELRRRSICHYTSEKGVMSVLVVDVRDLEDSVLGPVHDRQLRGELVKKVHAALLRGRSFSEAARGKLIVDVRKGWKFLRAEPVASTRFESDAVARFYQAAESLEPAVMNLVADCIKPLLRLETIIDDECFREAIHITLKYGAVSKQDLSDVLDVNLSTLYRWLSEKNLPLLFARPILLKKIVTIFETAVH